MIGIEERLRVMLTDVAMATNVQPDARDLDRTQRRPAHSSVRPPTWRRRGTVVALVSALLASGGIATATVLWQLRATESPFNVDGPLYCSGLQFQPPSEVRAQLEGMGYNVEWQYQFSPSESALRTQPPDEGAVIEEIVLFEEEGSALVLVAPFDPADPLHQRLVRNEDDLC